MEVGKENRENLEEKEDIIKELQERIRSEKNHRFIDLSHSTSLVIFVGSFEQEKAMTTKFYMVIGYMVIWFL